MEQHNSLLNSTAAKRWRNGRFGYGLVSQVIHWLTALLMVAIVSLGLWSSSLPRAGLRENVLWTHKSLGLLVIALTLARLIWMAYSPASSDPGRYKSWERMAARIGHGLLYAILMIMPLSGIMMSSGAGRKITFFNLFDLPQIMPLDPSLTPHEQYYYQLGKLLHTNAFEWALYLIFAIHLAGVIKHRVIDGHRDTIRRMWGWHQADAACESGHEK